MCCTGRGQETCDCSAYRSEGSWKILSVYMNTSWEGAETEPLFSVLPSDRTRGSGHTLKYRKFHLNIKKGFFTVRVVEQVV